MPFKRCQMTVVPVVLNLGPNVRLALCEADPSFPTDNNAILDRLTESYSDAYSRLKLKVSAVCVRYSPRYQRRAPEIRRRMLQAHIYADLAQMVQKHLPQITEVERFERGLVAWRALDDASAASCDKAQRLVPPHIVATPFELVEQGEEFRHCKEAFDNELAAGRSVWVTRVVFSYGNRFLWSPFWTLGSINFDPYSDEEALSNYLFDKGIPAGNKSGRAFVVQARLVPGATFVVRAAPGVGANEGGGIEIVTTWDGVAIERSASVLKFVKEIARTNCNINTA